MLRATLMELAKETRTRSFRCWDWQYNDILGIHCLQTSMAIEKLEGEKSYYFSGPFQVWK